jgi:hypothetical protein
LEQTEFHVVQILRLAELAIVTGRF